MTTSNGISVFDLKKIPIEAQSIAIHIEEIRAGQENLIRKDNKIIVPSGSNLLDLEVTAFDYTAISKLHFRYKLEGYDSNFHYLKPDGDRIISYSDLPAGDFQLKVAAAGRSLDWETRFSGMQITIPLPFYKNRLFMFTVYPAFIALLFGLIYLRVQKQKNKIRDKYKTVHIAPEKRDAIIQKLDVLLEDEKLYLDPDMSLKKLAGKLHIHANHLSRIINEKFSMNFNDLVNKYRIREAEKLLSDPENKEKTILELMYNCGFYSKSVFNTAFKKFTGQTPSEYRKKSLSP